MHKHVRPNKVNALKSCCYRNAALIPFTQYLQKITITMRNMQILNMAGNYNHNNYAEYANIEHGWKLQKIYRIARNPVGSTIPKEYTAKL